MKVVYDSIFYIAEQGHFTTLNRLELNNNGINIGVGLDNVLEVNGYKGGIYFTASNMWEYSLYSCNLLGGDLKKIYSVKVRNIDFINNYVFFYASNDYYNYKFYNINLDINTIEEFQ
ncbi:hypothetical protein HMPREF1982_00961 [Clostridiales bacterium oral taxon 876 str. F0540]|nr:hypothetical protein HMPREF1982_00961 [Clostridiales bacterium oral taxon 876 str. F0540]